MGVTMAGLLALLLDKGAGPTLINQVGGDLAHRSTTAARPISPLTMRNWGRTSRRPCTLPVITDLSPVLRGF